MLKRLTAVILVCVLVSVCAGGALAASLRKGSRGGEVTRLQEALKAQGFYSMKVDGVFGNGTLAAVKDFQRKSGLKADGIAGPLTLGKLYETPAKPAPAAESAAQTAGAAQAAPDKLRLGDSGPAVEELKRKLWYTGYYTGEITPQFDADTRSAVTRFQKAARLSRDGIAGKKTLAALEKAWTEARAAAGNLPDAAAALLNRIRAENSAVCGALALSKDGKTFLTWSFGGADDRTCFRIASVTKWVTAIGLMTLYDAGKLDLDRDISDYLHFRVRNPRFPNKAITARMLLSHTSSFSAQASNYRPAWEKISRAYNPVFDEKVEPGTKYVYADYNGALFGCLIEAISGESVQDYLNRTVFAPLRLTAAYSPVFLPEGTATRDLLTAAGKVGLSVESDRKAVYNNKPDPRGNNGYTVGRLYINAESLTRLAQMMLGRGELDGVRVLKRETVALMEADQPGLSESKYGLSNIRLNQFPGGTWYGHQGRYLGLTSNVYYQPATGMTLALIMDGYNFTLEDNIVMPAVTLMKNMGVFESLWQGQEQ